LGFIFLVALAVRFYSFKNTIYFGFDEARDALVSESIYVNHDIKLIGPPATGDTGLFHGPVFWYLIGPFYLLLQGDLYLIAGIFRVLNALGVFIVFLIAKKLFSEKSGLLAASLYALSFEQVQYSYYVGKESLALLLWLVIVLKVVEIYKQEKAALRIGLPIIALCFGLMIQFNIIYAAFSLGILVMLLAIWPQIRKIKLSSWTAAAIVFGVTLSTYFLAELKYNFREIKSAIHLIQNGFGIMNPGQSKYSLYWDKYLVMFRDNLLGISTEISWQRLTLILVALIFTTWLTLQAKKEKKYLLVLIWLMSWVGLMLAGGHLAYYTNLGMSVAILIGMATILEKVQHKRILFTCLIAVIFFSNLYLIYGRRDKGLITGIKPQPYMNLVDEREVVDLMYKTTNGKGFTLRLTGIPYKIQTVWYYLLREYGYKKYGYFPYWEHGNIIGYPGKLPVPSHGTTCVRFLVREPMTGLPVSLVNFDEEEENLFSKKISRQEIGQFTIEERVALAKDCHNDKP
jgi:4-amino-4-deoxy-L-arabinose transferase-like glycosyltransferase